ncbi:MAG: nitroreductase family protein [Clostridia bacterium]|nr:nitroreductase family protein [Clostridia bacterium]
MTLKDLIIASRSYRSFDESAKISREQLANWVDHARLSPSSINLQMLKFRLVHRPEECAAMLANTRWAGKLKDLKLPPKGHAPVAYIVICADTSVIETADKFLKDVGICAQSIMLAAAEAGFGGCMIGSFSPEILSRDLALSDNLIPQLVLALGKPDEQVALTDAAEDGSVTYYRENGIHYVQKRALKDLILE